jgi:hypothetical protein
MCEAFRFARIPFKIIIARYSQNKNEHDFQWAIKYCQRHSLQYQFFDIDIFEFFKSQEFVQITSTTGCSYPMLTATMKLMSHVARDLNGIPVLGSGECQILRQNERWLMVEPEPIQSLYRYLITNRLPGVPGFFQWSPELMLAFLVDPLLVKMTKNELQGVESSMDIKAQIYKNYFSFELRPKYRGYEMFQDVMQEMLKRSMSIVGWPLVNWKIEYSELKTRLTPKIQKY